MPTTSKLCSGPKDCIASPIDMGWAIETNRGWKVVVFRFF